MRYGLLALALTLALAAPARADGPQDEYRARRAKLDWSSPAPALELARFCLDKGLKAEGADVLIELLKKHPFNGIAKKMLTNDLDYVEVDGEVTVHASGAKSTARVWKPRSEVAKKDEAPRKDDTQKKSDPRAIELPGGWRAVFPSGTPEKVLMPMPDGSKGESFLVRGPARTQGFQLHTFELPAREVERKGPAPAVESVFAGARAAMVDRGLTVEPLEPAPWTVPASAQAGKEFDVRATSKTETIRYRTRILIEGRRIVQLAVIANPASAYDAAAAKKFFDSLEKAKTP